MRGVPLPLPTQARLHQVLRYDPISGWFFWKIKTAQRVRVGDVAGGPNAQGYWFIGIDGTVFPAHRVAWKYFTGVDPLHEIDHLNGVRWHNAIRNLRDVVKAVNQQNRKRCRVDSKTGVVGVGLRGGTYVARINVEGRPVEVGRFDTSDAAAAAHLDARRHRYPGNTL